MGLLGNGFDDPQTAANLALAGNMVRGGLNGGFGGGLLAAGDAYQQAQNGLLHRQLTQAQLGEIAVKNQMEQYQLKRLQNWDQVTNGGAQPGQAQPSQLTQPAIQPQDGGALGSGTFGISTGGQPATAQQGLQGQQGAQAGWQYGLKGLPENISRLVAQSMGPDKYMELLAKTNGPQTDIEKLMASQGIAPDSALGRQILQTAMAKANYVAPSNIRPGGYTQDMTGNVRQFPHVPDGYTAMDNGRGGFNIVPVTGGLQAVQGASAAGAMGKAEANPTVSFRGTTPVYSTQAQDVRRAEGLAPQPGVQSNFQGDPGIVAMKIADIKDPQERANAQAAFESQMRAGNGQLTPQLPPGVSQGAVLSQEELSKKGASLMSDNAQTNTVISRLQNVKMLAPGAITGGETTRRDYFNSLLALAGIKGAEDAKTASDLVDKNASQIVSALRMGQGGAGTDALQTLLGAANPNRHMTKEAIAEAADQLIASQKMIQDKARVLQPHMLGRDPVQYGQKEMAFDQNADPRVWQLESMTPTQQSAYVKSLPPEVAADMLKKRKALKAIGALK